MAQIKGFYITQWNNDEKGRFPGPAKKINAQLKAMQLYGYNVTFLGNSYQEREASFVNKLKGMVYSRLPFTAVLKNSDYSPNVLPDISGVVDADFIYIRFYWGDYPFGQAVKKIRKQNPNAKIFLEFPDYPYLGKARGAKFMYMRLKDKFCSRIYKNNVDYMVTMEYVDSIYNVPAIHMYNGIDTSRIKMRSFKCDDQIDIGFVATTQKAHGLDRLVLGLREYYARPNSAFKNVVLHIAGGGEELGNIRKLVAECKLEDKVFFYGYLFGEQLDALFDKIDLGIDYLAPSRDGIKVSSSLKTREYLSRGIPVITGAYLDICMDKKFQYMLVVEDNDNPIDVGKVTEFYIETYKNGFENVIKDIRKFAIDNIDVKSTMKFLKDVLDEDGCKSV